MIKFIGNDSSFTAVIKNEKDFLNALELKLSLLLGDKYSDKYTAVYKTRIFDTILENLILEEFIRVNPNIEKNKPYIVTINIKDESYSYLIADVKIDEANQGYIINKTLQS